MKYKVICILLLLPVLLTLLIFTSSSSISLPTETKIDRIVLEHQNLEAVKINDGKNYRLYAHAIPASASNAGLVYTVSDETLATVVKEGTNYYLHPLKEGTVRVFVTTADGSSQASFDAYLYYDKGLGPQEILITDPTRENQGLSDEFVYGRYDLEKGAKVDALNTLDFNVLGTDNQGVELSVVAGSAKIEGRKIRLTGSSDVTVKARSLADRNIEAEYTFKVIPEAVNIYSYDDLMRCTNLSADGEKIVLRTHLESRKNALVDPENLNSSTLKNTALFGRIDGKQLTFDTVRIDSTYDTTFLKNMDQSTELTVGLQLKDDLYGNGFTINLHELCYPSQTVNGKPINGNKDLYKGPLAFVEAAGMATVFGQDNIGTLISGDGILVSNVQLKNCNNVADLTFLENVGTTLEIMGRDVTVRDSIIANGRNVVRSFSNEGVTIDHSLLQYAREFILKIGSNSFVKPPVGQTVADIPEAERFDFLSPDLPLDPATGKPLSDSSLTLNDTFFYNSGFFSVGIDTHFAGELLYDATQTNIGQFFPEVNDLAGTSYATYLTVEGDTRFYDWKDVSKLDASTLIKVLDGSFDVNKYFDLQKLVMEYITKTDTDFDLPMTVNGKTIHNVHGGIAFYGGGKNFSEVTFAENLAASFKNIENLKLSGLITSASGSGPFRFSLYTKNTVPTLFGETPSIGDMKRRNIEI